MRKERTARIHVKENPTALLELQHAASLAGADDFSSWVRDTLRKAAQREFSKVERRATKLGESRKGEQP